MKLLEELFAQGLLQEDRMNEMKKAIEKTGETDEEIILERKIVSEDFLFNLKSKMLNIPFRKVRAEDISSDILELIPEEASMNYRMIPISKTDKLVQVGMVYPENIAAQNALRFLANQESFSYQVCLIAPSNLENLLKQRRNISSEAEKALRNLEKEKGGAFGFDKKTGAGTITEEAPIIKVVLVILRHAIEGNASDIHVEPGKDRLTIRFRLNGILHPSLFLPLELHPSIVSRIKILSGLKIDETRIPQDGRFSARINDMDVDFRVSTFPSLYGEKVEVRVLDPSTAVKSFEELGLEGKNLEMVKSAIKKPYGMILSTGPTGSGKTTTQYAILRSLNQDTLNIVTIEDPIEYSIPGVNQSQTKPEIGWTFSQGLRQILRQDPNIIMVGEIRDEETADLVINAALTGHIVLSTLHTNSSVGVVPRLIDMGVRTFLIPSTLKLIISQRLVRILCPACKIKIRPSEKIKNYLLGTLKSMPAFAKEGIKIQDSFSTYSAKGCESCSFSGYIGRTGLFEVLPMTNELADLIQKNPLESLIFKLAQKQGMLTMEQEGVLRVLRGQTTIEEIARVAGER